MYPSLAVAAALTLGGNAAAEAQTRPPVVPDSLFEQQGPFLVTNPAWIDQPRPEFPPAASAYGLASGTVVLTCIATIEGRATDCEVQESEPGFGFGAAALTSLPAARLHPLTVNGVPVEASFRFRVRFLLRDRSEEPVEP